MSVVRDGSGLWVPSGHSNPSSQFRKADPPVLGTKFGQWSGSDLQYVTLPGGAALQFDLNRLTLNDYRSMRDHYQINANLTLLSFMLHQIDWKIECSDKQIKNFIEEQIRSIWTQLIKGLSQAFWAGYSPMAIEYENNVSDRTIDIKKIKDLLPDNSRVNWREVEGYSTSQVKPKIKVYDGIKQLGRTDPIPVDNTLWYPLLMENGDYYGRKLLRPAFIPWFFSNLIHLFANRYYERFGEPLPIGRADYDAAVEVDGEVISGRKAMEGIVSKLRSRSVVVMPSDRDENDNFLFDLEYLESQMRGADWERYLTRLDEEMSLGLFTPILMLRTADVGSYNLGVNHMQVWMWMLNALAGDMKHYIDKYVVERIKAFNFNQNAPKAEWVYRPMGKANTETIRSIVTELLKSKMAEPTDLEELGQHVGLSLKEIRQLSNDDVEDDPGSEDDPRTGRPERTDPDKPARTQDTIENSSSVMSEIIDRVRGQVVKAFRSETFGTDDFLPSLGYQRRLEEALVEDGLSGSDAKISSKKFYDRLNQWCEDFVSLGDAAFSGPDEFITAFGKAADVCMREILE